MQFAQYVKLLTPTTLTYVACTIGCGAKVPKNKMKEHSQVCSLRVVQCHASNVMCQWTGKHIEQQTHHSTCPYLQLQPILQTLLQVDTFPFHTINPKVLPNAKEFGWSQLLKPEFS